MTPRPQSAELSILQQIQHNTANPIALRSAGLRLAIGDDAALWQPRPGHDTILTTDWFLEGIHFLSHRHPSRSTGWKSLARATSDIAAMGGVPRCFLLSLALPSNRTGAWLRGFLAGLQQAARTLNCALAGGDTTRSRKILINITVVGESPQGTAILRSGARPGDLIYVTGRLGQAEYGLRLALNSKAALRPTDRRLQRHLFPVPRLATGLWLAKRHLPNAMMDLSDGLSSDLAKLCAASGVGARVDASRLPKVLLSSRDQARFSAIDFALHGGDDYELLFTVPRIYATKIPTAHAGVPLTRIGEITAVRKILLIQQGRPPQPLPIQGWDPFR